MSRWLFLWSRGERPRTRAGMRLTLWWKEGSSGGKRNLPQVFGTRIPRWKRTVNGQRGRLATASGRRSRSNVC